MADRDPLPARPRFPERARSVAEALTYYRNRVTQALRLGWRWDGTHRDLGWGVEVTLRDAHGHPHRSVFVLEGHTGQGHLGRWFEAHPGVSFVSSSACPRMHAWLEARGVRHVSVEPALSLAYQRVAAHYGDRCARRSGQHLMNHIDEGLFALRALGVDDPVIDDAWCLHPLVQDDAALAATWASPAAGLTGLSPHATTLAMAYREAANAHLARHPPPATPPSPGPLPPVADLLRADKIQNRKDFELYLRGDVANSDALDAYFARWLRALDVDEATYERVALALTDRVGLRATSALHPDGARRLDRLTSTAAGARAAPLG